MLEHDGGNRTAARGGRDEYAVDVCVVLGQLQRAAELGHLDRPAREPRDAGGPSGERREHRLVAAAPELARRLLVDLQLLDQISAAGLVELVELCLGEL